MSNSIQRALLEAGLMDDLIAKESEKSPEAGTTQQDTVSAEQEKE